MAGERLFGWRGVLAALGVVACVSGASFLAAGRGGNAVSPPFFLKGIKRLLRNPLMWVFVWLMGLAIGGQFGPYSVMMLHLTDECGFSDGRASALLSASRLASPFAVVLGGFLTARLGAGKAIASSFALYSLSLLCLAAPLLAPKIFGLFLQPMMAAMAIPAIFTLVAERFAQRKQTNVLALGMPLASFAGTGAVPSLLGLCGTHATFGFGFAAMGVLTAASILLLPLVRRT